MLAFLAYAAAFWFNLGRPTKSSRWCYEINQKKRAMANAVSGPKLLLVGGSGTLFGINAKAIQSATGLPTVNLGTHAALGIPFILQWTKELAKPGDTVLLTFEYELYREDELDLSHGDEELVDYVIARDPKYFAQLPFADEWKIFMLTSNKRLKKGFKNLGRAEGPEVVANDIYYSGFLDECGDQTHNTISNRRPNAVEKLSSTTSVLAFGFSEKLRAFDAIEAFCRWAQEKKIYVLATYPNLAARPDYYRPEAKAAAREIRDNFTRLNVPVLADYTDSILPADMFYDTLYHLTQEAAVERTRKLLPLLKAHLQDHPWDHPIKPEKSRPIASADK